MAVRFNITMDEDLCKRISAFIADAVRSRLLPDRKTLDAAYRAASRESWRRGLASEWKAAEGEGWPD